MPCVCGYQQPPGRGGAKRPARRHAHWSEQERELLDTGKAEMAPALLTSPDGVNSRQSLVNMRSRSANRAPATWRTTLDQDVDSTDED